ncbi:MAG: hypothetical protein NTV05_05180 [Acidobacteria bacterium]|nr:hypothetical protein [Acidobacteriota bacterium]
MRAAIAALLVLLVVAPASAQSLRRATATYAHGVALDYATTYQALGRGARETNPVVNWIPNRSAMLAVGAAGDAAGAYLWVKVVGKKHRRLAAIGLYVAAGVRVWLAVHNDRVCRPGLARR